MIQINKPPTPPRITYRGESLLEKACKALKDEYDRHAYEFDTGQRKFKFNNKIYANKAIKKALKTAQHDKCCFCESKITHIAYGDVEHFRPKGAFAQQLSDPLQRPGYYWLAYDWSNLFLSCQICNQRFKKSLFPLLNPEDRARNHHDDLSREQPLYIHPADENPEEHITFREAVASPHKGSRRGQIAIRDLGLNRTELVEKRLTLLDLFRQLIQVIALFPDSPEAEKARQLLRERLEYYAGPSAEYSAMIRANFLSKEV